MSIHKKILTLFAGGFLLLASPAYADLTLTAGEGIDVTSAGAGTDATVTAETSDATNPGIVELATTAETATGTDATRAVTPDGLEDGFNGSANVVTVGALDSGSITSNFGSIDNGASAITTTGVITGGTVEATTDTAAGDNSALGYTAVEGAILTGQGSTYDVTIKNDADGNVIQVPTGATVVELPSLTASEIVLTSASKGLVSAAVATYPSLTELTYVKGLTSAAQTQFSNILDGTTAFTDLNATDIVDSDNYAPGSIDDEHIADDVIQEPALNITNAGEAGTDNYLLSYNHAGTNFTWVAPGAGGEALDATLAIGADANDVDITSMAKLEGVDVNTYIDMDTTDIITTKGNIIPSANGADDLGTDALEFNNAWFDGTMEADTITEGGVGVPNLNETDWVGSAEMADEDHGDVAWSGGAAEVQSMSVASAIDSYYYPGMYSSDTGSNLIVYTDGPLVYTQSTGTLAATEFSGGGASITGIEGTQILSTGVAVSQVLTSDGDNTCSWQAGGAGGETLAQTLAIGADANDVDITSIAKLEGVDVNTYIDMDTTDIITTKGNIIPSANGADDLGTDALEFNNAWFDGTMEADAITIGGTAIGSIYEPQLDNSAGLAAAISDEQGTGVVVFSTSPTLTTPVLGVASSTSVVGSITLAGNPALGANTASPGANGIIFEGAANDIEGLLQWSPTTADRTLTLPDGGNYTLSTLSKAETFSAVKTFSASPVMTGTGTTLTGAATLAGNPAMSANRASTGANGILFEGTTADNFEGLLKWNITTADKTVTLPNTDLDFTNGFDPGGAIDIDYGSEDITDHTFVSDGGSVILDGTITCGSGSAAAGQVDIGDAGGFTGMKFNATDTTLEMWIDGTLTASLETDGTWTNEI